MAARVFVTGPPGIGKTTTAGRVVDSLRARGLSPRGFLTEEVRENGTRIGFDVVTMRGERFPLARLAVPGQVGRYKVDVTGLDHVIARLRHNLASLPDGSVLVIDEIGPMEERSQSFHEFVEIALGAPLPLLATVKQSNHAFLAHVRRMPGVKIMSLTAENRDLVVEEIAAELSR